MAILWFLLVALFAAANSGPFSISIAGKPRWSQIQRQRCYCLQDGFMEASVDPRVRVDASTTREAAILVAKSSGPSSGCVHSWARKRAYRRARNRAMQGGGTWYRGVWRSAKSLGVEAFTAARTGATVVKASATMQGRRPRIRILTYNLGGMGSDLYDVLLTWLGSQASADIIVLQETHWGLGRGESQWTRSGWHFVSSASEDCRHAGVCVCISAKLAQEHDIDYQVWSPGRLLHVRVHGPKLPIDVVALYQWVDQGPSDQRGLPRRTRVWDQLDRLLTALPKRNLLALAGDFNSVLKPGGVHVGHGVLSTSHQQPEELVRVLQSHDLCVLNSWKSARPQACSTFHHGETKSQIDFVVTRLCTVDPQARASGPVVLDLAPWRRGPKHWPVQASLPYIGPWVLKPRLKTQQFQYSLRSLRHCQREKPQQWQTLCDTVAQAVAQLPSPADLTRLNASVLAVCRDHFPPEQRNARNQELDPHTQGAIAKMWQTYRLWRGGPRGHTTLRGRLFGAWRKFADFRAASLSAKNLCPD